MEGYGNLRFLVRRMYPLSRWDSEEQWFCFVRLVDWGIGTEFIPAKSRYVVSADIGVLAKDEKTGNYFLGGSDLLPGFVSKMRIYCEPLYDSVYSHLCMPVDDVSALQCFELNRRGLDAVARLVDCEFIDIVRCFDSGFRKYRFYDVGVSDSEDIAFSKMIPLLERDIAADKSKAEQRAESFCNLGVWDEDSEADSVEEEVDSVELEDMEDDIVESDDLLSEPFLVDKSEPILDDK